jgi:phosphoglucomutase
MVEIDILGDIPAADFDQAVASGLIELIGPRIDELFLGNVMKQALRPGAAAKADIVIVYTPFYGAGAKLVPEALRRLGVRRLHCVQEQMAPDGNFPTAKNPNPEFSEGFERAIALAEKVNADIIIAATRQRQNRAYVRESGGGYRLLRGIRWECSFWTI